MIQTSSFFKYKGPNGVSIALTTPPFWKGPGYFYLYPTWDMINKYKKTKNEKEYIKEYNKVLEVLNPIVVYDQLDGMVLLCWEPPGEFCHRRLVAKWLENELGIEVPEIGGKNGKL